MMHKTDKVLHYNDVEHGYEAIGIPYSNQEYYMYLILPNENTNLKHLIHEVITYEHIQHVVSQSQPQIVDIKLPSMKLKTSNRIKEVLSEMGVGHLFQAADWSNMLLESQLKVSEIWHYVEMEINEKGSDISVGTTEEFKIYSPQTSVTGYQHQFYAQRPYLFFIYHPLTKTVIFYGSISTVKGWEKM
jgi:serine protease inhibitor